MYDCVELLHLRQAGSNLYSAVQRKNWYRYILTFGFETLELLLKCHWL